MRRIRHCSSPAARAPETGAQYFVGARVTLPVARKAAICSISLCRFPVGGGATVSRITSRLITRGVFRRTAGLFVCGLTWTDDDLLRQVVYQGLREDKGGD
jgi:hypothetical protein